jgi:ribulose-phosphate 3-epimerase
MADTRFIIAASILSADFLHLAEQIRITEEAGADWLHLDVMDGRFVPNLSMGPFIVEACRQATKLPLDVHLMVDEPDHLLDAFARAGADHLTVHIEACSHPLTTLEHIKSLGLKAGISLKPSTSISAILPLLPSLDGVLVMSVEPGYSGQKFEPISGNRIAEVRRALAVKRSDAWLAVDGGINPKTIRQAQSSGANVFIAATAIYQHPDGILAGIRSLRSALH